MDQPKLLFDRLKVVFTLLCSFAALYMTITQIVRYYEDKDSSMISYKHFNLRPQDEYPTFSICFKGIDIYWPDPLKLFETFGMTTEQYAKILKGDNAIRYKNEYSLRLYRKEIVDILGNSNIAFEEHWYLNLDDFLVNAEAVSSVQRRLYNTGNGKYDDMTDDGLFYVGYQNHDTICFTRKSNDEPNAIRIRDIFTLKSLFLKDTSFSEAKLRIFIHPPNQLLRYFDVPSYEIQFNQIKNWNMKVELHISQVTVLRKRKKSQFPCNHDIQNDDLQIMKGTVSKLGCVPVYWATLSAWGLFNNTEICNAPTKLQTAYLYANNHNKMISDYDPPCASMTALVMYYQQELTPGSDTMIQLVYATRNYQEIENLPEFGFESFWSSVGGFIGIFMGYSLLQIPELLGSLPTLIVNLKMAFLRRLVFQ